MRNPSRLLALGAVSLAALMSLGALPAAAKTTSGVSVTHAGFSLKLPAGWKNVPLTKSAEATIFGSASHASAAVKKFLTSAVQGQGAKSLRLLAFAPTPEAGGTFFANLNIGLFPGTESNAGLIASAPKEFSQIGGKELSAKVAHYPFGSAVEETYSLSTTSGTIYGTQFYVARKGQTYVLTFTAAVQSTEANAAATVMPTWHYT